jgi:hypothetical protein
MNLFDILNRFRRTSQTLDDINFLNKIYVKLPPKDNIYFTLMLKLLHPIKMFLNIHLAIHLDFYHKTYILIHVLFISIFFFFFFLNMYHILSFYKISWDEMILKSAFESSCEFENIVHDFTNQKFIGVHLLNFMIMQFVLFKLTILIHKTIATLMVLPYICDIWKKYIWQKF